MDFFVGRRGRRVGPGATGPLNDKFEKFTGRARKVLSLAQEEAVALGHNYIGTEHLLLGLVREGDGLAAMVLRAEGVELDRVRAAIIHIIGRGDRIVHDSVGLTPRAKKVIELAMDEARRMNHQYIGTEHLLLGILREGEGIAAGVLESQGLSLKSLRTATIQLLNNSPARREENEEPTTGAQPSGSASGPKTNVVACRLDDATLDAIDALVEAGIRNTRSDAAAWLIGAGIEAHRPLFERVNATVNEIRQLRAEAQAIAQQVRQEATNGGANGAAKAEATSAAPGAAADATPATPDDTPPTDGEANPQAPEA